MAEVKSMEHAINRFNVKYDALANIINNCGSINLKEGSSIDIYIDCYRLLRTIHRAVEPIPAQNPFTFVSGLLNVAGHYRGFFNWYGMNSNIYLVYADESDRIKFADHYPLYVLDHVAGTPLYYQELDAQFNILEKYVAYIPNVYLVRKHCTFATFAYADIQAHASQINQALLITKDPYAWTIPSNVSVNCAVLRPAKSYAGDVSYLVDRYNVLTTIWSKKLKKNIPEGLLNIDGRFIGLIYALSGLSFKLKSKMHLDTAINMLLDANARGLLGSYTSNMNTIFNILDSDKDNLSIRGNYIKKELFGSTIKTKIYKTLVISQYFPDIIDEETGNVKMTGAQELQLRFSIIDLQYQNTIYFYSAESIDESWRINLYDPDTVSKINDTYLNGKVYLARLL